VAEKRGRGWANGWRGVFVSALLWAASLAGAEEGVHLDERVNRLTSELRCLVCQNQTIADSHSELATQLKNEVRRQMARGASDEQVRRFMVDRYGEFVLYRPPVNHTTWLLWGGPALLLALGGAFLAMHWRERRSAFADAPDSVLPEDEVSA
jgi:cytochrome c-type biogenesis protein CcmH